MTKEEYESILGAENLARWERMAASNGTTGQQLAELISSKVKNLTGTPEAELDLEPCAPVSSSEGNVISVNFKAAAPRKNRSSYQGLERRSESRIGLMKITVPSTSPTAHPSGGASAAPFGPFHVT